MKRLLAAALLLGASLLAYAQPAQARFIDGYLAECSAVSAGSCTELAATGYARQPIGFAALANGLTTNALPYTFAQTVTGTIAGRAVYDAATGGNLLAVIPLATPLSIMAPGDRGDVGALKFTVSALSSTLDPLSYNGAVASGATLGMAPDGSTVTAGVNEAIVRGVLAANLGAADGAYRQTTQVTGFSYQIPNGISSVQITGAGTLAAGTITLQQAPLDGALQRLLCAVTVTSLTVTPGSGQTFTGTAPTTCGAGASHEFQYFAASKTWNNLF